MTPKTKIFLITKDKKTVQLVNAVACNGSSIAFGSTLEDLSKLPDCLDNTDIYAGIVDIDPDPQGILGELEALIRRYPRICAVVVSEQMTQELILSAMQAGARHFLQKGSIHTDLSGVMGRLLTHTGAKHKNGSVVTVFSAGGGCGATTVALNLAMELRITASKPVLVIDLDRCYGAAADYLAISSEFGIDDVLRHEGLIDTDLIRSTSSPYKDDFHVLFSPGPAARRLVGQMDPKKLRRVLKTCRQAYAYTVIDAPRMDEQTVRLLSEESDFTIVVFQLTLKDLKFARSIITMCKTLGLSDDKIIPLANRFKRRGPLMQIVETKKALGTRTMHTVRSDWNKAMHCVNRGKTLAEAAPRSALRKDLRKLATYLQAEKTIN